MSSAAATVEELHQGAVWRVTFAGPKGNVLDASVVAGLTGVFQETAGAVDLRAICLEGEGSHFSFGSSVQEHLPKAAAGMLQRFRELLLALLDSGVPTIAAVRGRCLGGGLELASLCHRIVVSRDATFGQPEIRLGVFAPVASVVLAERIGRGHAEDLCLSGRTIGGDEALRMGLVDQIAEGDPMDAALAYATAHFVPLSASSLRFAVAAGRVGLKARLESELAEVERLYLDELMRTGDAVEGLTAFLEKRPPRWKHQ